ncbi:HD domain-containing protein [Paludicola sp. MB14-C6]|uniref:HD domain-containing protein n=1 Tax=Paludihabitans sp. MB14-C6 TaxID=3070656 RepID=UPI0027DCE8F9|nr:HD domain-containing protein [Paludicola sp. MB14-C6]WMJ22057.1 HD domain-containing protein [Paludicola sp. MB14-C6]
MKCNTRHSWTSNNRHESVAEHSWRLAVFAYCMKDEFSDINMDKVMLMCLTHDIGEAVTGDIPSFLKTDTHEEKEEFAIYELLDTLDSPQKEELKALFQEMLALETNEAKLYKALDKLEAVMQHNQADLSTWIPIEYELNQTYANEEVEAFPYLKELREILCKETQTKIAFQNRVK